ncbi:MAG: glycosyltransferase family 4 protein [Planctomycetes bacterium]|nr:glycosyltransferase family 4 protein [Planctomycetota bacterium]
MAVVDSNATSGDAVSRRLQVLHIADPLNPSVGTCGCALIACADGTSSRQARILTHILLIGPAASERLASVAGVSTHDRISPPHGSQWAGLSAFRRYVRRVSGSGKIDLVHAWSLRSLSLATIGLPTTPTVITLTHGPDSHESARWLAAVVTAQSRSARTTALAISNSVKREWVQSGVPQASVHVVRPGIDLAHVRHTHRDTLRKQWSDWAVQHGAASWSDDTQVVGVLADDVRRLDLLRAARVLGLSRLAGPDVAMIVPAGRLKPAYRLVRGLERSDGTAGISAGHFIVDDRIRTEPWNVLPAVDAALILGDDTHEPATDSRPRALGLRALMGTSSSRQVGIGTPRQIETTSPGALPMLWAAAAGVPIVGEACYAVSEMIESGHSGLLTIPGDDRGLIRRLTELRTDAQAHWRLADTARSEAFSFFSPSRYRRDLEIVYEQIVQGQTVDVPDLPMTGGLAFSGRM